VAVAEAIDAFLTGHRTALKWPNDVLLEGRKTCGMLLESSLSGTQAAQAQTAQAVTAEVVVLGVGLNVNQTDFPEALADTATSLHLATGRTVPRAPLFAKLLQRLEVRYDAVQAGDGADVRAAFHDRLAALHESVTLRESDTGETITGVVQGITDTGALRLDTPNGPRTVHAGDVTSRV
jgi:BirA family biotin operon repressor/biotin-[acetyl-CoA-carboxylase] ligase